MVINYVGVSNGILKALTSTRDRSIFGGLRIQYHCEDMYRRLDGS